MAWKGPPRSAHAHEAKTASFQVGDPRNLLVVALSCLLVDKYASGWRIVITAAPREGPSHQALSPKPMLLGNPLTV